MVKYRVGDETGQKSSSTLEGRKEWLEYFCTRKELEAHTKVIEKREERK